MKYGNVITLVVFGSNSIIVNGRKFPRNDKINQKRIQYLVSRTNSTLRSTHPITRIKPRPLSFFFIFFPREERAFLPLPRRKGTEIQRGKEKWRWMTGKGNERKGRQYRIKRGLRDMNNSGCVKMSQNRDSTEEEDAFSSLKSIKSSKRADSPRIKENICRLSINPPISPSSKMAENREGARNQWLFIHSWQSFLIYS